ncbi:MULTISPECIES: TRAP transporter large permease [Anaerotruncus]|jgi:C4-dicarboxylate transporter DctM subunit|uniref:TRAP transporter large permease n=1 Tax=Anaerotruncus TaxID=244127 RepID=UPI000E50DA03|nr:MULTISPECIES: TRAP transporter large permease [Anaerotruncus]RGX56710.1 TRAP transporter large permease [Anaerotruncus sp. AF02-27]
MAWLMLLFFVFLFLGFPIAFILLAVSLIGAIFLLNNNPQIVVQMMFNGMNSYTILAVPFFIISGGIAARGGTAKSLINVMKKVFGKLPGGLGIATIFACTFFAAISGSSLATIVALGTLMIPTLIGEGYDPEMATGIVNSAGSLGILIPPSVPMVTMSVAMGLSVAKLFAAGFLPGIILAIIWSVYVAITCKRTGVGTKKTEEKERYGFKEFLKDVPALFFPIVILGSIYGGIATPTEAAAISIVYITIIEVFYYKTCKLAELPAMFGKSTAEATIVSVMLGCAAPITWFVTNMQLPAALSAAAQQYIPNKFVFIIALTLVLFVFGCFMDIISVIVILGPMVLPTLIMYGMDPIHFGIMCILNTQIGMMTPPFGMNIFVCMRVANMGMGKVVKSTMPYLILLIIATLVISFIPEISMFVPNLLAS